MIGSRIDNIYFSFTVSLVVSSIISNPFFLFLVADPMPFVFIVGYGSGRIDSTLWKRSIVLGARASVYGECTSHRSYPSLWMHSYSSGGTAFL